MKSVTLIPLSRKGKNVITNHGAEWFIRRESNEVLFPTVAPGPWLLVETPDGESDLRWVSEVGDPHFKVQLNS